MNILITGATGMVGNEVLLQAIADPEIHKITAIVRNKLDISHPKLTSIVHKDFLNYDSLSDVFKETDACIWCLGISQLQVSKQQYITITYQYTMEGATSMLRANPNISMIFVSGGGADSTEKSRTLFARIKGQTENALQLMKFKRLVIARPGGIQPINNKRKVPFLYRLGFALYPLFNVLFPSKVITSVHLAKALLYLARNGSNKIILENQDLKALV